MFPAVFNLANLNGQNGFYMDVISNSVANIGDINGDGIDDLGIGCSSGAYVVFSSASSWPIQFEMSALNGQNGFSIFNLQGSTISSAGDINLDGIADFMIGDTLQNSVFIVFGSKAEFPNPFNILSLNGNNGFIIPGISVSSIANAGDVNGDGHDDIIIASSTSAYTIYAGNNTFPAVYNTSLIDGSNGFTYVFNGFPGRFPSGVVTGYSNVQVNGVGDINNDGFDDVGIGALISTVGYYYYSWLVVIWGAQTVNSTIYSESLDNQNSFVLTLAGTNSVSNIDIIVISGGKDLNGDGIDDLAIGFESRYGYGGAQIYFGASDITSNNAQFITVTSAAEYDKLGASISAVDDVNGDGIADVLIGAPSDTESYAAVMFGHNLSEPFPTTISASGFNGINGFNIEQSAFGDSVGSQVSTVDINDDGVADMVIAASGNSDFTYIVFGQKQSSQPSNTPSPNHDSTEFSAGEIAGIAVGAVMGAVLIGATAFWYGKTHGWFGAVDDLVSSHGEYGALN